MKNIENKIEYLNRMTELYDQGKPEISDKEWDDIYFSLSDEEKKDVASPTNSIHYEFVNELQKVIHEYPMLSLDKTKNQEEFSAYFGKRPMVLMQKLDGLTCALTYENGLLVRAETRGNGTIGEDITHNAKYVKGIPQVISYKDKLIVHGEVICTYNDFKEFAEEYKNPRNFASGSIRLLDSKECAKRKLTFVAWNVVEGLNTFSSFATILYHLGQLNFIVVPFLRYGYDGIRPDQVERFMQSDYPTDGLVGRFDDIEYGRSLGSTDHHSRAAYAFKFYDEEYETELIDIEWSMGRTGQLTPVAIFKPVDIDGTTVERASLHNYSVMTDTLYIPFEGQRIAVAKMNMIIPQIVAAEKIISAAENVPYITTVPDKCPVCGGGVRLVKSDSGVLNLVCDNPNCYGKFINRLDHFCGKDGLDIHGVSISVLNQLIEFGWMDSYKDLFNLDIHKTSWYTKSGFGKKSVDNLLAAIEQSKTVPLDKFICAIGIPLIGKVQAQSLANKFTSWKNFRKAIDDNFDFSTLPNFGEAKKYSLLDFDYSEFDDLVEILTIQDAVQKQEGNGKKVCITGSLIIHKNRQELVDKLEAAGHKVVSSVTSNTDYLINNDINSTSSKNQTAKKLGVPIVSESEFISLFDIK